MTTKPAYPHIHLETRIPLSSFPTLAMVALGTALAQGGVRDRKINRIFNEVEACDPDELLAVFSKYVRVTEGRA